MRIRPMVTLAALSILLMTGCSQNSPASTSSASSSSTDENSVEVVRVIDGDTVEVKKPGETKNTRVRLLNVDTPETKHPNKIIECMGPEATKYLEDLLPEGTPVTLEHDIETHDNYGRELAGVYKDGTLINADIAREGLGTAVLIEPNKKFYPEVLEAQNEAEQVGKGLFDSTAECSIPAQAQQLNQALDQAPTSGLGQSVEEASQFLSDLDELTKNYPHLSGLLKAAAVKEAVSGLRETLKEKREEQKAAQNATEQNNDSVADAPAAPVVPPAQTENRDGNQPVQQAPVAPVIPEAPRQPQVPEQQPQQRAPQPPPVPQAPPAPAPAPVEPNPAPTLQRQQPAPAPAPVPEPKYTGCRSYAPGGKSWTPIPCN